MVQPARKDSIRDRLAMSAHDTAPIACLSQPDWQTARTCDTRLSECAIMYQNAGM